MGLLDFLKPKETRVNELYSKGWNLEAEKKYEEAVQVYDQIINFNPQAVSAHILKGDALSKMKKYEEAIRTYNKANGIKQDGDAYAGIGFALMGLDRYEEAIKSFRDANSAYIEKSDDDFYAAYKADRDDYAPGAFEAHYENHYGCGGYRIKKFHELMEKKCKQLINAGKYREAIKVACDGLDVVDTPWESYFHYVNRSLEAMGKDVMADKLFDKYIEAEDALRRGENDKASEKMSLAVWHVKHQLNIKNESQHIIIDYPDDPVIPSTTPRASDSSSQLPKIIKRHAQKLVTGTILFLVVFGVLTLIPWNNNDSQGTLQEVSPVSKDTESAASYSTANELVNKGIEFDRLGKYDEAIQAYDKAIEINSNNAIAWSNKGSALDSLGRYDEAIQACEKAIEIDPKLANALIVKGTALHHLGRDDEALEAYEIATVIDPKSAKAWINKGNILGRLGRYDESIEALDKAIEIKPNNADAWGNYAIAWDNKGVSLTMLSRYDEAIKAFDKAIEIKPNNAWNNKGIANAWSNKGIALRHLGRDDEASVCDEKAAELESK